MFLEVTSKAGGGVSMQMQWDLDHAGTFDGSVTAEGLRFMREGVAETAVRTDGDATGLKHLAGKADIGRDEIGRAGGSDVECRILPRSHMDTEEGQRPVQVQTIAVAEIVADRLAILKQRVEGQPDRRHGGSRFRLFKQASEAEQERGRENERTEQGNLDGGRERGFGVVAAPRSCLRDSNTA